MTQKNEQATVEGTTENQATDTKQEVATTKTATPVAVAAAGSSYITAILEQTKKMFVEINAGLDLDFVRMGDCW